MTDALGKGSKEQVEKTRRKPSALFVSNITTLYVPGTVYPQGTFFKGT